jgi:hypothetical protein
MKLRIFTLLIIGMISLGACAQGSEVSSPQPPTRSENTGTPEPSIDPCQVFAESQAQLTEAIGEFASKPSQGAVTILSRSFDSQVEILGVLVDPVDLNAAIELKDDAVEKFEKSQETDNVFEKGILLAGAALSAKEALELAQALLLDLNQTYDCNK